MGQARELLNSMTAAFIAGDLDGLAKAYAADAVAVTPEEGEIHGREAIIEYFRVFNEAFPDGKYEALAEYEVGNVAIDEGFFVGTNTGALPTPTGETIPPTGKQVRLRACDVAVIEGSMITSHRFYYDQMDFLSQLGLLPDM